MGCFVNPIPHPILSHDISIILFLRIPSYGISSHLISSQPIYHCLHPTPFHPILTPTITFRLTHHHTPRIFLLLRLSRPTPPYPRPTDAENPSGEARAHGCDEVVAHTGSAEERSVTDAPGGGRPPQPREHRYVAHGVRSRVRGEENNVLKKKEKRRGPVLQHFPNIRVLFR